MSQDDNKTRRIGFSVNIETFDKLEALSTSCDMKYTAVFEALVWGASEQSVQEGLSKVPEHLRINKQTLMSDLMKLPAEELANLLAMSRKANLR